MNLNKVPDNEIREEFISRFKKVEGAKLKSTKDTANHVIAFFQELDMTKENFVVIYLDNQLAIIDSQALFVGTINSAAVYPRTIIENVISKGANGVILAHNHPSGETSPSSPDRNVTAKINTALSSIDVDLLDHIIVGKGCDFTSFADMRLL
jgi:DNA repair protein RadC